MEFEAIKNSIQKFTLSSIVDSSLLILNQAQVQDKKNIAIWNILILVKWAYLYTKDETSLQKAYHNDIEELLSMIERLEYQKSPLDFKQNVKRSLRIIAYQQFWFQEKLFMDAFQRQIVLYLHLESSFDVDDQFRKLSGIGIKEFLNMCFVTHIYLNKHSIDSDFIYDGTFYEDYFEILTQLSDNKTINIFLNLLTLKYVKQIENSQKMTSEGLQLYETNFWSQHPFIIHNSKPQVLHRAIFNQTTKYFLYDYMKMNCMDFTADFGKRVERYLELGLKESSVDYQNESNLKKKFRFSKVSDYMVESNVLIECKAIELHPRSGVTRDPGTLARDFRDSIVKAYRQLLNTAKVINPERDWYGIVVTYKDTFTGYGQDAWDEFMESPLKLFLEQDEVNILILPPDRLCFITLETWDRLIETIKQYKTPLAEILKQVFSQNKSENPEDKVLLPEQALEKLFPIDRLELLYLKKADRYLDIIPTEED